MTARRDNYPDQADSEMQRAQDEAARTDGIKDDAETRVEELEVALDAAEDAAEEAELVERLHGAEKELQDAETDFESAMDVVGDLQRYWYEDDDDDDDDD